MLQLIYAYLVGLGPYVAVALGLGFGIPLLLLTTKPARWLVAFLILFLCLVPFGGGELAGASEGSIFRQIGWGSAFLIALFLFVRGPDGSFTVHWDWLPVPYVVLLLYALASVFWAEQPWVSARRAVQLVGVLLIALSLVRHKKEGEALLSFAGPGLFFLVLGVVAIAMPRLSFDLDGNYKGFTFTKNVWGQFALVMALIFMFRALGGSRPKLNWSLFIFASGSLIATRSATTITIYVIAIAVVLLWVASKRFGSNLKVASLALSLLGVSVSLGYFIVQGELPVDAVFASSLDSVGKDVTLTGRTDLWRMMGYEIARHPWIGAGYGGFWLGLEGPSFNIVRLFSWRPGQAHNGYIDVVNELGYVGLTLVLVVVIAHLRNIQAINRQGDGLVSIFHLSILVSALLLNVSETSLMRTTHLWWIILSISIVEAHVRVVSFAAKRDTRGGTASAEASTS